jgi:hypothetical protein
VILRDYGRYAAILVEAAGIMGAIKGVFRAPIKREGKLFIILAVWMGKGHARVEKALSMVPDIRRK